ncbi:MAG: hypothetical protein B7Y45_10130 [Sphingomonas sp. 28-66-16]|nr:MAG: hypothetical protein B7Y45_10130 [Sphingomonas sp. 28-66-16]
MTEPTIDWKDILEVGLGGPGCGQLYIDGKQPKGAYRYLPPALIHEGKVYASTFVPGGFILCVIDPASLTRQELSAKLPYARLQAIEDGEIVYVDRHDGDSVSRLPLALPQPFFARLAARLTKR